MGDKVLIGVASEVLMFEERCNAYQAGLEQAREMMREAISCVAETWRDADFLRVEERFVEIDSQINKALNVIKEDLLPFMEKKRMVIIEKKGV